MKVFTSLSLSLFFTLTLCSQIGIQFESDYFRMDGPVLEVINSGRSVFIGESAGSNDNLNGNQNTAIGYESFLSNIDGFNNTAIGHTALRSNLSGYLNMAAGYRALYSNTTGYSNTATGCEALFANTEGSNNTSTGYYSLYNNTTGIQNTATGSFALHSNTIGKFNIASGSFSMYSNTEGNENTSIGRYSLFSNTMGSGNTASGHRAMSSNTTGEYNTATGIGVMYSNTIGTINTAAGYETLYNTTDGSYNTAFGAGALSFNTTGSYNTGIGTYAEVSVGNLTNATVIGAEAIVDASNKVRIGNDNVTVVEFPVAPTYTSDRRLKENIADIELGLDFLLQLHPVQYTKRNGNGRFDYGFIAQEIKAILADNKANMVNKDSEFYTVRYNDLIAVLVKAIQEQQEVINQKDVEIRSILEYYELRLAKLENNMDSLNKIQEQSQGMIGKE